MACYQIESLPSNFTATGRQTYATEADCLEACAEGACCEADGSCNIKSQCECEAESGAVFAGDGETCEACAPADCCGEGGRAGQPLALLYDNGTVSVGGTYSGLVVSGLDGSWNVFAGESDDQLNLKFEDVTFGIAGTAFLNFRSGNCSRAGATLYAPFDTAAGRRSAAIAINPPTDGGLVGFPAIVVAPYGPGLRVTAARFAGITLTPTQALPQARFYIDYHNEPSSGSLVSVMSSVPGANWQGSIEFDWELSGETGTVVVSWNDLISADECENPLP